LRDCTPGEGGPAVYNQPFTAEKGEAMSGDRYLKVVLTVIALELAWIGVKDAAPTVSAQAEPAPTSVIIRGIQMPNGQPGYLPVTLPQPLEVEIKHTVTIATDSDRPLKVESVPYTPLAKPGE
jgi:hypothetical protein